MLRFSHTKNVSAKKYGKILLVENICVIFGEITFHHVSVLKIIVNIGSFIKNTKSTVPTSKQPRKIKFVKKGTRLKNKNSSFSGILHQASDWVVLVDLDGTFSFPPHIAFTELKLGKTI